MKFLNLRHISVDFETVDIESWAINNSLDRSFRSLSHRRGVSVSRVNIGQISTFHRDGDAMFYCNDDLEFYIHCVECGSGDVPTAKTIYFEDNLVNESRITWMLKEIGHLHGDEKVAKLKPGLNIWKAESCELALAG